ncbi:hypothetical protein AB3N60_11430 [Leptospira sp. WS39.C2]
MKTIFIGQKYIDDTEKIDVNIGFSFFSTSITKEHKVKNKFGEILILPNKGLIYTSYTRKISKLLSEDLNQKTIHFYLGYISDVLPIVNNLIYSLKYNQGILLAKPISYLDILEITVENIETGKILTSSGLLGINSEKPSELSYNEKIYIRDTIDALSAYLYLNYEDCIRKIITAIECYFSDTKLKGTFKSNLSKVLSNENYPIEWHEYIPIIKNNLILTYTIRNLIVHDKLRMSFNEYWGELTIKSLFSLFYFFQNILTQEKIIEFNTFIFSQFSMLKSIYGETHLDTFEEYSKNSNNIGTVEESNYKSFDDYMFKRLQISDLTRKSIINKQ